MRMRAAAASLVLSAALPVHAAAPERAAVRAAIGRGLEALAAEQKPSGGFDICFHLPKCDPESTVFTPALVAASLRSVDDPRAARIAEKATAFVMSQREPGGLWRFYAAGNRKRDLAPPNADDTACAAALQPAAEAAESWRALAGLQTEDGSFVTWTRPKGLRDFDRRWIDDLLKGGLGRRTADGNDVDCAVNANVLWMAASHGRPAEALCRHLNRQVRDSAFDRCSLYYVSPMHVYYFLARAYGAGARCLDESRERLERAVLARVKPRADALETASALASLHWLGYRGPVLDEAAARLLERQQPSGAWRANLFIRAARGSTGVTTAVAVQALNLYASASSAPVRPKSKKKN